MSLQIGRLEAGRENMIINDQPTEGQVAAMLSKQDEIIDALAGIAKKLDFDDGVTDVDYRSLFTDLLSKIDLKL